MVTVCPTPRITTAVLGVEPIPGSRSGVQGLVMLGGLRKPRNELRTASLARLKFKRMRCPPGRIASMSVKAIFGGGKPSPNVSYVLKGRRTIKLQDDSQVIGSRRGPQVDVVLPVTGVSGIHCKIDLVKNGIRVTDLGSTNGTTINGREIKSAIMKPGQKLGLGNGEFELIMQKVPVSSASRSTAARQKKSKPAPAAKAKVVSPGKERMFKTAFVKAPQKKEEQSEKKVDVGKVSGTGKFTSILGKSKKNSENEATQDSSDKAGNTSIFASLLVSKKTKEAPAQEGKGPSKKMSSNIRTPSSKTSTDALEQDQPSSASSGTPWGTIAVAATGAAILASTAIPGGEAVSASGVLGAFIIAALNSTPSAKGEKEDISQEKAKIPTRDTLQTIAVSEQEATLPPTEQKKTETSKAASASPAGEPAANSAETKKSPKREGRASIAVTPPAAEPEQNVTPESSDAAAAEEKAQETVATSLPTSAAAPPMKEKIVSNQGFTARTPFEVRRAASAAVDIKPEPAKDKVEEPAKVEQTSVQADSSVATGMPIVTQGNIKDTSSPPSKTDDTVGNAVLDSSASASANSTKSSLMTAKTPAVRAKDMVSRPLMKSSYSTGPLLAAISRANGRILSAGGGKVEEDAARKAAIHNSFSLIVTVLSLLGTAMAAAAGYLVYFKAMTLKIVTTSAEGFLQSLFSTLPGKLLAAAAGVFVMLLVIIMQKRDTSSIGWSA